MSSALNQGESTLSDDTEVIFRIYSRTVLPLDGYVFWTPVSDETVQGSLHYKQTIVINTDETFGDAEIIFTSGGEQVTEFLSMPLDTIYVGTYDGIRFAFSRQDGKYDPAGIWHYWGRRIPPAMLTQLLDTPGQIDVNQAVNSNSIPLWLQLRSYKTPFPDFFANSIPLYPADLVSPNLVPPYGAIDVLKTESLQPIGVLTADRSDIQLASDQVDITLYGMQNNAARDFLRCVIQYTELTGNMGLMNGPIVSDGPRRKSEELQAIAMKKVISFTISYYQLRVAQVARGLIEHAQMQIRAGTFTGEISAP
jgi:hypothetical protein